MVITEEVRIDTQGHTDIRDITPQVAKLVAESPARSGAAIIFCPGSTCSISTIEYESGALEDLRSALDRVAPTAGDYRHHLRWGDDNGHSHVRAAVLGPSLTVPFTDGALTLGTWQQIILLDFDTRPRERRLVVQIVGE
jgi:secondary thiamine-phosphate synthase enzyme